MNEATCKRMRADLQAILDRYYETKGIQVEIGSMRYSSTNVQVKITFSEVDRESGAAHTPEYDAMMQIFRYRQIDPTIIERTYQDPNIGEIKVVGFNRKRPKFPWDVIQVRTGKQFKYQTGYLKLLGVDLKDMR